MPRLIRTGNWPFRLWNVVQFQIGWFALVLSAAAGQPHWGGLIMILLVLMHLLLCPQSFAEGLLLVLLALAGWCWESAVQASGWLVFAGQMPAEDPSSPEQLLLAPWWMAFLWINFATVVNHSLAWVGKQPLLAIVSGMIGGPLAFIAGERLGAVQLLRTPEIYFLLAFGWGCLLPLAAWLGRWLQERLPATVASPTAAAPSLGCNSR